MNCTFTGHLINDTVRKDANGLVFELGARMPKEEVNDIKNAGGLVYCARVFISILLPVLPINAAKSSRVKRGVYAIAKPWSNGIVKYRFDPNAKFSALECVSMHCWQ